MNPYFIGILFYFVCINDIGLCGTSRVGVPQNEQSEFWGFSCAPSLTACGEVSTNDIVSRETMRFYVERMFHVKHTPPHTNPMFHVKHLRYVNFSEARYFG